MTHTDQISRSEFVILGAGAIGSIVGAHLARAGHSVVMVVREGRARAIESEGGLRIKGLVEFSIPVQVVTDASRLRAADVLIVATKTPGTAQALEPLRHLDVGAAFSIQNGLVKNDLLAGVFGVNRTLGALANVSGELLPSGEVLFTRNVKISIGALDGAATERAQKIADVINASGVNAEAVENVRSLEWSKFVGWVGLMAMSVATRATTWKYLIDHDAALLLVRLVRELGSLANAEGVNITDHSILPTATLLRSSESQGVEIVRQAGHEFMNNAPDHRMSTLQDVEAGRPLEVEETLGYAVTRARNFNLSLPLLESFYHLVAAIDRTRC
jgi:2-dehydropantoate 2-reductase